MGSVERTQHKSVLVTGASGYLGRLLVQALADDPGELETIVAMDLRSPDERERLSNVTYVTCDIRSEEVVDALREHEVDVVVHLAAVVSPGRKPNRELEYSVDVLGTRNVLDACLEAGAGHVIVSSSGAAYGYHADNPDWLVETDALRGNVEFAYSDHKRLVEEMLARYRREHPELRQLILRPGTILGATTANQITDIFDKDVVIGLAGVTSRFVLIWDKDVVGSIIKGIREQRDGIFNLAGDGTLSLCQMAEIMGKRYLPLPVGGVRVALAAMKKLGITQYGPEQVRFLRYRPVLCNRALKEDFGYVPRKTTREVFDFFLQSRETAG